MLELTEYLGSGYNITTDNYFTSLELATSLRNRVNSMTLLGTIRKNRVELPPDFIQCKRRALNSSIFGFTPHCTLVSYVPKPRKCVVLLSTMHHSAEISDREDQKPEMILAYNKTKGGVDTLDLLLKTYRCYRRSPRWPFVIFEHILNIALYNSFILWKETHPGWKVNCSDKRRQFLLETGKALVIPQIRERRRFGLQTHILQAIELMLAEAPHEQDDEPEMPVQDAAEATFPDQIIKTGRCHICPRKPDRKSRSQCQRCLRFVCRAHSHKESTLYCNNCYTLLQ